MRQENLLYVDVSDKQRKNRNGRNGSDLENGVKEMERKKSEDSKKMKVILEFPKKKEGDPDFTDRDLREVKGILSSMLREYVRAIS